MSLLSVNRFHYFQQPGKIRAGHKIGLLEETLTTLLGTVVPVPLDEKSRLSSMHLQARREPELDLQANSSVSRSETGHAQQFSMFQHQQSTLDDLCAYDQFFSHVHMRKPTSTEIIGPILNHPVAAVLDKTIKHRMLDGVEYSSCNLAQPATPIVLQLATTLIGTGE